jgi:hypothetical protein
MKKGIVIALVFACICFIFIFIPEEPEYPTEFTEPAGPAPQANFTLLIYMVGSDLESEGGYASEDLQEMMKAKTTNGVNIIIETGGTLKWYTSTISSSVNQRFRIHNGNMTPLNVKLPNRNMGKAETLTDFLKWGIANYPAEQYGLVMWNHGSGSVKGFGADEWFDHDMLTIPEMKKAFTEAQKSTQARFEWIGFDACLMATIETASALAPFGNFLTASEELEPGHGWEYTSIVNAINSNPAIKGDELGSKIMQSFKTHAEQEGTAAEITLSTIQLNQVSSLVEALNELFAKLQSKLEQPTDYWQLAQARRDTEGFGSGSTPEDNTDMADVGDWAKEVRKLAPAESDRVLAALRKAVIGSITSDIAPDATGLSLYFPYWNKVEFTSSISSMQSMGFSKTYETFIRSFSHLLTIDTEGIDLSEIQLLADQDDMIEIDIPKNLLNQVADVYSVLGMFIDEDETQTLILGMDNDVDFNKVTGKVRAQFTGSWVTLNDSFITMDVNGEYDDMILYNIPALVNREDADIVAVYDLNSEEYRILGYWNGIGEGGVVDRDITELAEGDEITPILEVFDEITGETTFEEGESFIWTKETPLQRTELNPGAYSFGFLVEDFAQNLTYTDFYIFDVE